MPKISEIVNPAFRSGVSAKTGKPWTLMTIKTDDGKEASMFAPAVIGDEVTLTYSAEYKNYNAEKVTQRSRFETEVNEKLDRILAILKPGGTPAPKDDSPSASVSSPADELPPVESYDSEPPF